MNEENSKDELVRIEAESLEQLVAEEEGKVLNPDRIFFETYDVKSGALLKNIGLKDMKLWKIEGRVLIRFR